MSAINIPGYKIINTLGVGGQATVYLAIQQGFEREIALKVMSPALAADPSFGERFIREAKIVAKLRHPGIVTVFDVGEHDGFYYLAMEYLPETDLRTRITQGMKAKDAIKVIQKIAKALHYAHGKGYIHRDVKSENILFRDDGEPVLTDFGIAKASNSSTQMTQQGKLIGTPQYMSPEQCRGRKLDGRSDIYSLGIILYEMLTQSVPFDGEDSVAVCLQHVTKPVPRLSARQKHYQWLLDRMLAKKVEDRFEHANELADDIEQFLAGDIRRSQQTNELRASRDEEHTQIFEEDDDIVADERMVDSHHQPSKKWPWMIVVVLIIAGVGYFQKDLWLPHAQKWYLQVVKGQSESHTKQQANNGSGDNEALTETGNSTITPTPDTEGSTTTEPNAAEQEAKQKQIAQLLVEADTLEPLPDLDPSQMRQLLQNYVRVLVLDPENAKALTGKSNALKRAADYASQALDSDNENLYLQYFSVIESISDQHPLLSRLTQDYDTYQQEQKRQEQVAEQRQEIQQWLSKAKQAVDDNRLTTPEQDNAYYYYNQVLAIDPQSSKAQAGLNSINDRYVKLAQQAMLNKNIESANASIKKLSSIAPDDPRLPELNKQYQTIKIQVEQERRIAAEARKKKQEEEARKKLLADPLTQLKINSKLNAARDAYAENRLVIPEADSALNKYKDVLQIDPKNERALEGIKLVQSKLVELSKSEIQQGNKANATAWLEQLKQFFPDNAQIPVLQQLINEMDITISSEQAETEIPEKAEDTPKTQDIPTTQDSTEQPEPGKQDATESDKQKGGSEDDTGDDDTGNGNL